VVAQSEVWCVLAFFVGVDVYGGDGGGAEFMVVYNLSQVRAEREAEESTWVEGMGLCD
jgi:hypothetical protein